ncbi:MAG TPA: hypothetical protein VH000_11130 [Rhizomicrobium sp.]|nr:hypothetical protein [Rhizomicrobium sp.]HEX4534775.1 hypothetical protein [Rhizomicrobium sp.]
MKTVIASVFALALVGATAASAQSVGAGVHVGGVGVGASVGSHTGVGAHVGHLHAGAGVHIHGRTCHGGWYWHNHHHYCRRW